MGATDNDKEELPPEVEEWWTKDKIRKHGRRLDNVEKDLYNEDTGILPRLKRMEREVKRWLDRENWWKGILNKVIGTALIDMVMAHFNRVAGLLGRPEDYGPLIIEDPNTGELFWEFWLEGFMRAVVQYPDAWKQVIHSGDDGALAAMMSIMSLSRFARERSSYSLKEQAERDCEAPDEITEAVLELNRYAKGKPSEGLFGGMLSGLPHFSSPTPSFRAKRVGRNDPCPCGSGRKYKKCCGAN